MVKMPLPPPAKAVLAAASEGIRIGCPALYRGLQRFSYSLDDSTPAAVAPEL
jgi:hypothetical protein